MYKLYYTDITLEDDDKEVKEEGKSYISGDTPEELKEKMGCIINHLVNTAEAHS